MADPGETRLLLQAQADVAAESMGIILECWERLDQERRGLTAAEVIHRLKEESPVDPPAWYADLTDAIIALVGKLDARLLGNKLRSYRRRIFQGRFIDHAGAAQRAVRWAVFSAKEFSRRPEKTHETHQTHDRKSECSESRESLPAKGEAGPYAEGF
jgi:hypothetical protein